MHFDSDIQSVLTSQGWTTSRSVDCSEALKFLAKFDFIVVPAAETALRNLFGLQFELSAGSISRLVFDPRQAVFSPDYVSRVAEFAGEPVTLIGAGGGYLVMMTQTNRAFLLQDEWFCLLGFESLSHLLRFAFFDDRSVAEELYMLE
jgi:hypothetical protein